MSRSLGATSIVVVLSTSLLVVPAIAPAHATPADHVTHTVSSGNLSLPIPDSPGSGQWGVVTNLVNQTTVGSVVDLKMHVRLSHTRTGDLMVRLDKDGRAVAMAYQNGGDGDDFGKDATDCTGTFTVFDDAASTSIASGSPPFDGSFSPFSPLSSFTDDTPPDTAEGLWGLAVVDFTSSNTGTVHCWKLEITIDQDTDDDLVYDANDNCRYDANADQANADGDDEGDECDTDDDDDGDPDSADNCPLLANADQVNTDSDSAGDSCDPDDDNDGFSDSKEADLQSDPLDDSDPVVHQRSLTLRLRRHLLAKGGLGSTPEYGSCNSDKKVTVQKMKSGEWSDVVTTRTDADGRYRRGLADKGGSYRVVAGKSRVADGGKIHICSKAISKTRTHSH